MRYATHSPPICPACPLALGSTCLLITSTTRLQAYRRCYARINGGLKERRRAGAADPSARRIRVAGRASCVKCAIYTAHTAHLYRIQRVRYGSFTRNAHYLWDSTEAGSSRRIQGRPEIKSVAAATLSVFLSASTLAFAAATTTQSGESKAGCRRAYFTKTGRG